MWGREAAEELDTLPQEFSCDPYATAVFLSVIAPACQAWCLVQQEAAPHMLRHTFATKAAGPRGPQQYQTVGKLRVSKPQRATERLNNKTKARCEATRMHGHD